MTSRRRSPLTLASQYNEEAFNNNNRWMRASILQRNLHLLARRQSQYRQQQQNYDSLSYASNKGQQQISIFGYEGPCYEDIREDDENAYHQSTPMYSSPKADISQHSAANYSDPPSPKNINNKDSSQHSFSNRELHQMLLANSSTMQSLPEIAMPEQEEQERRQDYNDYYLSEPSSEEREESERVEYQGPPSPSSARPPTQQPLESSLRPESPTKVDDVTGAHVEDEEDDEMQSMAHQAFAPASIIGWTEHRPQPVVVPQIASHNKQKKMESSKNNKQEQHDNHATHLRMLMELELHEEDDEENEFHPLGTLSSLSQPEEAVPPSLSDLLDEDDDDSEESLVGSSLEEEDDDDDDIDTWKPQHEAFVEQILLANSSAVVQSLPSIDLNPSPTCSRSASSSSKKAGLLQVFTIPLDTKEEHSHVQLEHNGSHVEVRRNETTPSVRSRRASHQSSQEGPLMHDEMVDQALEMTFSSFQITRQQQQQRQALFRQDSLDDLLDQRPAVLDMLWSLEDGSSSRRSRRTATTTTTSEHSRLTQWGIEQSYHPLRRSISAASQHTRRSTSPSKRVDRTSLPPRIPKTYKKTATTDAISTMHSRLSHLGIEKSYHPPDRTEEGLQRIPTMLSEWSRQPPFVGEPLFEEEQQVLDLMHQFNHPSSSKPKSPNRKEENGNHPSSKPKSPHQKDEKAKAKKGDPQNQPLAKPKKSKRDGKKTSKRSKSHRRKAQQAVMLQTQKDSLSASSSSSKSLTTRDSSTETPGSERPASLCYTLDSRSKLYDAYAEDEDYGGDEEEDLDAWLDRVIR